MEDEIFNVVTTVTNYINNNGRFLVTGRDNGGEVQYQGVDNPNNGIPYSESRVMVQPGTLNHHITRIDTISPGDIDLEVLHDLKFNITTVFRVEE